MGRMFRRLVGGASGRGITVAILVPVGRHRARGVMGRVRIHWASTSTAILSAMRLEHGQLGVFHDRDDGG